MQRLPTAPPPTDCWSRTWFDLARASGIGAEQRLLLALSGGADSVLLLQLLAAARPKPDFAALHVDYGLRGAESRAEREFCERLCRSLGVALEVVELRLAGRGSLEARARHARYAALLQSAEASGRTTILTGHQADDGLETLLLRWLRGSAAGGLDALAPRLQLKRAIGGKAAVLPAPELALELVRPLLGLRRAEIRQMLRDRGLSWCEDSSNQDRVHRRNALRLDLVPWLTSSCGPQALDSLFEFQAAVRELEDQLARATAPLRWQTPRWTLASRALNERRLAGCIARSELMALAPPLRRRALWRLLTEGTGTSPRAAMLERMLERLSRGSHARFSLGAGFQLQLRSEELLLVPPGPRARRRVATAVPGELPFPESSTRPRPGATLSANRELCVPGSVTVEDGRRIRAEFDACEPGQQPSTRPDCAELDASHLPERLCVRLPRAGDRFRGLGAPGSRSLTRFLADAGVPESERAQVLLVCGPDRGDEILWVVGLRPCERHRLRSDSRRLLRLRLED